MGVGSHTGTLIQARLWEIYSRDIQIVGSHQGTRAELRTVLRLVGTGRLQPMVDRAFPHRSGASHRPMTSVPSGRSAGARRHETAGSVIRD